MLMWGGLLVIVEYLLLEDRLRGLIHQEIACVVYLGCSP
jgi:hypothetical protein